MGNNISRIAGHKQNLCLGMFLQYLLGEFPAIHLRHDHIGEDKIDNSGIDSAFVHRLKWRA